MFSINVHYKEHLTDKLSVEERGAGAGGRGRVARGGRASGIEYAMNCCSALQLAE